jgi:hypothetical protein
MALSIKKITLWRKETDNQSGAAAKALQALAGKAGNLTVVMGYRIPGNEARAVLEIAPVTGKKAAAAAAAGGLTVSETPALLVQGDDRAGLGLQFTNALAVAGINLAFLVAQVVGRRFSAVFGFESAEAAGVAASLLKKAAKPPARPKAKPKAKSRPKRR